MERDLEKKLVQRDFNLEIREVEKEDRTLEFPFSSEQGVARYFGNEVLEHTEKGADLTRLNDGAPVLWNHNPDQVIGVVERAWIDEKKKRGYAQVRFSDEDFAASKFRDIKNGIIRNISFGYVIKEMEQRGDDYVANSWEAYEISAVAIPADNSIGINRAAATTQESDNISLERNNSASSDAQSTSNSVEMTTTPKETLEVRSEAVDSEKLLKAERSRITNIQKAAERHDLRELGSQYVAEGRTVADFNQAIVDNWKQEPVAQRSGSAEIGMEEKEVRSFSFLRACNYLANPTDSRAREAAAFEIEASEAAAAKLGRTSRGITIPQDVLTRDLQTSPGSAGGDVIREELLTGSFIDILRNESACARAGATVLSGLEGNIKIPKQSGAASATWIAEGAAAAESDQTLTQVSLVPRTVGAYTDVTRKLLLQSSIDIENFVRNDLARVIALKIDLAGLYGSGVANEPLGIKNVAGIGAEAFAGAVPTFLEVIAMESDLGTANALVGSPCYITNASMRGSLKGTKKDAGSGEFLWTGGLEGELNGYRALVSNQIAAGDVWFGNFSDLLMGFWSGLDLTVDPYTNSTSGTVRIVALQDCDVAVRNAESFCLGT
jgi:HK97 family phage major capsid protein/HK97 family phage prohead protease